MWRKAYQKISYSVHAVLLEIPKTNKHPLFWCTRGTAFVLKGGPQPLLITNAHVVCDEYGTAFDQKRLALGLFFPGPRVAVAHVSIRLVAKDLDIAILEASSEADNIPPVEFTTLEALEIGTSIASIGFPIPHDPKFHPGGGYLDISKRLATGFVSGNDVKANFNKESENLLHYELNMLSYPGISGAPVFNLIGTVVGINRGGVQFKNLPAAYGYAIRGSELIKYLRDRHIDFYQK